MNLGVTTCSICQIKFSSFTFSLAERLPLISPKCHKTMRPRPSLLQNPYSFLSEDDRFIQWQLEMKVQSDIQRDHGSIGTISIGQN